MFSNDFEKKLDSASEKIKRAEELQAQIALKEKELSMLIVSGQDNQLIQQHKEDIEALKKELEQFSQQS